MGSPGEPVLLADPRILAIPVAGSSERLVRLEGTERLSVAITAPTPPIGLAATGDEGSHVLVRTGLAERLGHASELLPPGVRLHVVEGYRPPAVQRRYFEAYRRQVVREHPGLGPTASHALASRFVAPPEVAAHPSGAAVDVTLIDEHGTTLDMGTPVDATPEASGGACYFDASAIGAAARANRRLLASCLGAAGLVNYPTEWWHWSHGDRYWAFVTGHREALYGAVPAAGRAKPPASRAQPAMVTSVRLGPASSGEPPPNRRRIAHGPGGAGAV